MKHITAIAVITLLVLPSGLFAMSRPRPVHTSHPVVEDATADVALKGQGRSEWEPVERGTLLFSGDIVRSGPGARASIRFASGTVKLYEDTEIYIPTTGDQERRKDIKELVVTEGVAFLDIHVAENTAPFRFKTDNSHGQVTETIFTISGTRTGTAINVFQGEALVSQAGEYGERTSSLVSGSSLRIEPGAAPGRVSRFDPLRAVESYRENTLPDLDRTSGLPIEPGPADNAGAMERSWSRDVDGDATDSPDRDVSSVVADNDLTDEKNDDDPGLSDTAPDPESRVAEDDLLERTHSLDLKPGAAEAPAYDIY